MARIDKSASINKSRRQFLVGSVSAGLVMAFAPAFTNHGSLLASEKIEQKLFNPTIWFQINAEGDIVVHITRAEMGQHVGTALARIVADELGADWNRVSFKHVDTDPKWGYMVTGGSWSVFQSYVPMSQAGAAGRETLIEAGAALLDVKPEQCSTQNSQVVCGNKRIDFGEVVKRGKIDKTYSSEQLKKFSPKNPAKRDFIAKPAKALDIPMKSNGAARYGIDVELEGMVYARPLVPPTRYGSVVKKVDDSNARKVKGYLGYEVLKDPSGILQGWVTVLADTYYGAIKAADQLNVSYQKGDTANVTEEDVIAEGETLVANKEAGALFVEHGDIDAAAKQAESTLEGRYRTSSALHFALEPVNATVEFKDGICHVYTGNQWQSLFLPVVAKSVGLSEDKVIIHQHYLGGGFGRRLAGDYMLPAALTAKAVNKPVKLVFTREDDSRFDCIRSPSVQHFWAYWDSNNTLQGIEHAAAAGWPTKTMAPGFLIDAVEGKGKIDTFSISGADHWYTLPNHRVRAINNPLAQETFVPGWLRAVGPGWIGWGVESFIDEVAHQQKTDPVAFRLGLLDAVGKNAGKSPESVGGAKRLNNVLKEAKEKAGWGRKLPENEGLGVAVAAGQERTMPTWSACIAHVKVNPDNGRVTVKKLTTVMDCGTVVHPDGALAQTEGAMLWGLSLALHEGTKIKDGQVSDTNLNTYSPLRMSDVPELDISFIENTEFPVGLGEPGLIAVAPAIGNAIFNAVGVRVRDLPITPKAIKAGLGS